MTGTFCAKHPKGLSGKRCLSPFFGYPLLGMLFPVCCPTQGARRGNHEAARRPWEGNPEVSGLGKRHLDRSAPQRAVDARPGGRAHLLAIEAGQYTFIKKTGEKQKYN